MRRRAFGAVAVGAALQAWLGCDRRSGIVGATASPARVDDARASGADAGVSPPDRWTSVDFPTERPGNGPPFGRAMFRTPGGAQPKPAALIALHGHAESLEGLDVGARAWKDHYLLDTAYARVSAPPLTSTDAGGFLQQAQLDEINHGLAERPFQGLTVACPFTPDMVDPTSDLAIAYGDFLVDQVLGKARELSPGIDSRVGIDGISMGGRIALMVGLSRPEVFRSVGCLQPFLKEEEAEAFAGLAARATTKQAIRLVTAESDPSVDGIRALSRALAAREIEHSVVIAGGGHDYPWIKTAGALEMLFFHDRALRVAPEG